MSKNAGRRRYRPHRAGALRGLGHLDDRRAEPLIAAALKDPDPGMRDAAALVLERDRSQQPGRFVRQGADRA